MVTFHGSSWSDLYHSILSLERFPDLFVVDRESLCRLRKVKDENGVYPLAPCLDRSSFVLFGVDVEVSESRPASVGIGRKSLSDFDGGEIGVLVCVIEGWNLIVLRSP